MFPNRIERFSGHDQKTPGTEKTPDTEKVTPDTIIHDTLPDPVSKISPPADQGRTGESKPCPL